MANTWLVLSNCIPGQQQWIKTLKDGGGSVIRRDQPGEVETLLSGGHIGGVLFHGKPKGPLWDCIKNIRRKHPLYPIIYSLDDKCPEVSKIAQDELHVVLSLKFSEEHRSLMVKNLLRVGSLHRRLKELEQESKSRSKGNSPLSMFSSLDINKIVDRLLIHFGPLVPSQNLHWLEAREARRLLGLDEQSFLLELQHQFQSLPLMRSYKETDGHVIHQILKSLPWGEVKLEEIESNCVWLHKGVRHGLIPIRRSQGDSLLGYLLLQRLETSELDFIAKQIWEAFDFVLPLVELGFRCWEAESQGLQDVLTPLFNQRFLPIVLDNEISRVKRHGGEFTVLFIDIDYFKSINDTRGHWIGSKLITQLGKMVANSIRTCDFGFRYGGDEFVAVLVSTGITNGRLVAEGIRRKIENTTFNVEGKNVNLTVSIGVATYPDHAKSRDDLIKIADQAMYSGKGQSRNIVYIAS